MEDVTRVAPSSLTNLRGPVYLQTMVEGGRGESMEMSRWPKTT